MHGASFLRDPFTDWFDCDFDQSVTSEVLALEPLPLPEAPFTTSLAVGPSDFGILPPTPLEHEQLLSSERGTFANSYVNPCDFERSLDQVIGELLATAEPLWAHAESLASPYASSLCSSSPYDSPDHSSDEYVSLCPLLLTPRADSSA